MTVAGARCFPTPGSRRGWTSTGRGVGRACFTRCSLSYQDSPGSGSSSARIVSGVAESGPGGTAAPSTGGASAGGGFRAPCARVRRKMPPEQSQRGRLPPVREQGICHLVGRSPDPLDAPRAGGTRELGFARVLGDRRNVDQVAKGAERLVVVPRMPGQHQRVVDGMRCGDPLDPKCGRNRGLDDLLERGRRDTVGHDRLRVDLDLQPQSRRLEGREVTVVRRLVSWPFASANPAALSDSCTAWPWTANRSRSLNDRARPG